MCANLRVAIIGAGLSGLGMALALHAHSIKCTVYEQSPSTGRFAGALALSPNSLRILNRYGLYNRIREQGYNYDIVEIKDSEGNLKGSGFYLGSRELFGYPALRIYRVRVPRRPKIRNSLFPHIRPEYNGVLVVCGSVKASSLDAKNDTTTDNTTIDTVTMIEGKGGVGAFLLGPQLPDASELLAGTQRPFSLQTREEWARLAADKSFHLEFLREGYDDRLPIVQRAVDNIEDGSTYIWPLQTLPKLERWWSERSARVILIGDAAHAMPPTSGQGANQAFEDGWTLATASKSVFSKGHSTNGITNNEGERQRLNEALQQ